MLLQLLGMLESRVLHSCWEDTRQICSCMARTDKLFPFCADNNVTGTIPDLLYDQLGGTLLGLYMPGRSASILTLLCPRQLWLPT